MRYFGLIVAAVVGFTVVSSSAKASTSDYYTFNTMNVRLTTRTDDLTEHQRNELQCLALNIYHEARSNDLKGKMAVGFVTLNRQTILKKSVCDVVYEKHWVKSKGRMVSQFSWTNTVARAKPLEIKAWDECQQIARSLLFDKNIKDFTNGATHFVESRFRPSWTHGAKNWQIFGSHAFFTMGLAS